MTDQPKDWDAPLVEAARAAMAHAHAPYSRFAVGAALKLSSGEIVSGANFENASLGLSLCDETVTLASANAAGKLAHIIAIAVVGGPMERVKNASPPTLVTPCGRCRQILAEAASLAGRDIRVYCAPVSGDGGASYGVAELLPHAFSGADLSAAPQG